MGSVCGLILVSLNFSLFLVYMYFYVCVGFFLDII